MLKLPPDTRIFMAVAPVDMRPASRVCAPSSPRRWERTPSVAIFSSFAGSAPIA